MRIISQINYINQNKIFIYPQFKKLRRFLQIYSYIISEDYKTFPVPTNFINQLCNKCNSNNILEQQLYTWKDIKDNYIKNWHFYSIFLKNIKYMLSINYNCTLKLIKFKTYDDIKNIFKKYPNNNIFNKIHNANFKGLLYAYTEKYDLILLINEKYVDDNLTLFKIIQHEIIHWMQFYLNVVNDTTYGIFDNKKFDVSFQDKIFLLSIIDKDTVLTMLDGLQFEPWIANVCQTFIKYNLSLNWYQKILQNKELFKKQFKYTQNQDIEEILIFGQICYLTSKNGIDDRYWYLIQAIKENIIN